MKVKLKCQLVRVKIRILKALSVGKFEFSTTSLSTVFTKIPDKGIWRKIENHFTWQMCGVVLQLSRNDEKKKKKTKKRERKDTFAVFKFDKMMRV